MAVHYLDLMARNISVTNIIMFSAMLILRQFRQSYITATCAWAKSIMCLNTAVEGVMRIKQRV